MHERERFGRDELDAAAAATGMQLAVWNSLLDAADDESIESAEEGYPAALHELESTYFNAAVLALDRRFVERSRAVAGAGCTPLNELGLIVASLMGNDGVLVDTDDFSYAADAAVLGLIVGEVIALDADSFDALATAVLAELAEKFVGRGAAESDASTA